ncbi:hypothetical protein ILUMI_14157 [Ignelater luminosus]|uniref:Uncharacterized protein n=1 Tax=Ignelater luminosus TaxID=2038154 RepID=A0A8K0CVE0_IGNLU|nr:hypothetical protein ILUMI_14157 [Ignelater luminosus]
MFSGDSSNEQSKKKRNEDRGNSGYFERSKKTPRSPVKQQINNDEKLDVLIKIIHEMKMEIKAEIKQVGEELQQVREEQKEYYKEVEKLKMINETIRRENKEIKQELERIKNNMEWVEKEKRKNNIVMNGLKIDSEDPTRLKEGARNFLNTHLEVAV